MAMTKGFICPGCGADHEGLPTDRAYRLPDDVWALPEPDRAERAKFDDDLCRLGDRFFIRCVLYIPFNFTDDAFGWGVWVEVSEETFFRYIDIYNKDATQEPPHRGRLANLMQQYPDAAGEELTIRFGDASSRPALEALSDSLSSLAVEQRNGIDQAQYHVILRDMGAL